METKVSQSSIQAQEYKISRPKLWVEPKKEQINLAQEKELIGDQEAICKKKENKRGTNSSSSFAKQWKNKKAIANKAPAI